MDKPKATSYKGEKCLTGLDSITGYIDNQGCGSETWAVVVKLGTMK